MPAQSLRRQPWQDASRRFPRLDHPASGTFARTARAWNKATIAAGLSGFHVHDLRHTGNVLAGEAGATLRELMDRMGHSTTRAALIYQHRTTQRDKTIADEISKRAEAELKRSGTQRARRKGKRS